MLPDGRAAEVRVALASDPYLAARDVDTVALDVEVAGELVVTLNTVLDPEDDSQARELAREVATGLASGSLDPTASALEPLADEPR